MRTILTSTAGGAVAPRTGAGSAPSIHISEGLSDRDPPELVTLEEAVIGAMVAGVPGSVVDRVRSFEVDNPDSAGRCEYWRAVLAVEDGKPEEAAAIADSVLGRGDWWGRGLFDASPSLPAAMQSSTRQEFTRRWRSDPTVDLITPGGEGPFPTLVVLHGQAQGVRRLRSVWPASAPPGWAVALVESSQHLWGRQAACWDDRRLALRDIRLVTERLAAETVVDRAAIVLAGFSQGAEIAALAARDDAGVVGLVMVAPMRSSLASVPASIPTWVLLGRADVVGGLDPQACAAAFASTGAAVVTVEPHSLGHVYPADFPDRLREALRRWMV